jgi:hypothetical protein
MIFCNFEMFPRCHGNGKVMTEQVLTKAMVQSTFVPSLFNQNSQH